MPPPRSFRTIFAPDGLFFDQRNASSDPLGTPLKDNSVVIAGLDRADMLMRSLQLSRAAGASSIFLVVGIKRGADSGADHCYELTMADAVLQARFSFGGAGDECVIDEIDLDALQQLLIERRPVAYMLASAAARGVVGVRRWTPDGRREMTLLVRLRSNFFVEDGGNNFALWPEMRNDRSSRIAYCLDPAIFASLLAGVGNLVPTNRQKRARAGENLYVRMHHNGLTCLSNAQIDTLYLAMTLVARAFGNQGLSSGTPATLRPLPADAAARLCALLQPPTQLVNAGALVKRVTELLTNDGGIATAVVCVATGGGAAARAAHAARASTSLVLPVGGGGTVRFNGSTFNGERLLVLDGEDVPPGYVPEKGAAGERVELKFSLWVLLDVLMGVETGSVIEGSERFWDTMPVDAVARADIAAGRVPSRRWRADDLRNLTSICVAVFVQLLIFGAAILKPQASGSQIGFGFLGEVRAGGALGSMASQGARLLPSGSSQRQVSAAAAAMGEQ